MGSGASLQAGVLLFVSFVLFEKDDCYQAVVGVGEICMDGDTTHTLHAWKRSEAKAEMYGLHVHGTHGRTHTPGWRWAGPIDKAVCLFCLVPRALM